MSWPALCRPSEFIGHGIALVIGIAGTSPAMTGCEGQPDSASCAATPEWFALGSDTVLEYLR